MSTRTRNKIREYLYIKKNKLQENNTIRSTRNTSIGLIIKMAFMAALLTVQQVCAAIKKNEVQEVQEEEIFKVEGVPYMANPDGPLSPIMLYLGKKVDYIYKKRMDSLEIKKYPSWRTDITNQHRVIFNRSNDKVYKFSITGERVPANTVSYYTTLISMFPSPNGEISIFSPEYFTDRVTGFLKNNSLPVGGSVHRILVALLLLAEGVAVPLSYTKDVSGKEKFTWTGKTDKETFSFLPVSSFLNKPTKYASAKEEKTWVRQNKLIEVIKFFLTMHMVRNIDRKVNEMDAIKKQIMSMNADTETKNSHWIDMMWDGAFSTSLNIIIQTYIYHYMESKEEIVQFNRMVCTTLLEQKATHLMDKFFIPKNADAETLVYWRKVNELEEILKAKDNAKLLPFTDSSQIPIKTRSKLYIRKNTHFKKRVYFPDMESALLGLFLCLAYDVDKDTYTTRHMPNLPARTNKVFYLPCKEKAYKKGCSIVPGEKIPENIYTAWRSLVRSLNHEDEDEDEEDDKRLLEYIGEYERENRTIAELGSNKCSSKVTEFSSKRNNGIPNGEDAYSDDDLIVDDDRSSDSMPSDSAQLAEAEGIFTILTVLEKLLGVYRPNSKHFKGFKEKTRKVLSSIDFLETKELTKELESYILDLFCKFSRNCVVLNDLLDLRKGNHFERKERQLYVRFTPITGDKFKNRFNLYKDLEIYYARGHKVECIILHVWDKKTAHLDICKPMVLVDGDNERVEALVSEIFDMEISSFPRRIILMYAQNIRLYSRDDIILLDSHIDIENNELKETYESVIKKPVRNYPTEFNVLKNKEEEIYNKPECMYESATNE
ncbi:hypothetical protein NEAUS03_1122 [Nematocida ausubeli]|nr:hypothetical protein NEAUS03_1122 [Nematocida ausubeli]